MDAQPKYLSAEERRAVTVDAVITLAATHNPSDITTAAIAKQMGVTQGALFRHFPTKAAIWESVMNWVADTLLERVDRASQDIAPSLPALAAMFMSHVAFAIAHPGVPRMLFGELQHAETTPAKRMAQTLMQRYGTRLTTRIEQGQREGEIAPEIDPQAAAILFIGTVQGLVMQSLLSGDIQRMQDHAQSVFDIYARGLTNIQ